MDKKTEALKLALESLVDNRHYIVANERTEYLEIYDKAIDAVEKALAEQPAQQDSTCNKKLREQGKAYPRTCKKCGLGPCIADRVQPAPVAKPHEQQELASASVEPVACKTLCELCVKRGYHFCANAAQTTPIPSPPASKPCKVWDAEGYDALCQELEGWKTKALKAEQLAQQYIPKIGCVNHDCDKCKARASKPWVALTDEDVMAIAFNFDVSSLSLVAKAIETKLRKKNA